MNKIRIFQRFFKIALIYLNYCLRAIIYNIQQEANIRKYELINFKCGRKAYMGIIYNNFFKQIN
jgi:hypothetical protein